MPQINKAAHGGKPLRAVTIRAAMAAQNELIVIFWYLADESSCESILKARGTLAYDDALASLFLIRRCRISRVLVRRPAK